MAFSSSQPFKTLEVLLHRMTDRVRRSIELPEVLDTTAEEMRTFLNTDRFKIYRFHEDGSGEVVAESIHSRRLPSLLGHRFPANDIPAHAREMFLKARQRTIVHVAKKEIGISCLLSYTTQTPVAVDLKSRPVDPCHMEYLTAMGVQSSLVVPILQHQQLWGLLVAHHSTPRRFGAKELELVQLIADQVSVAIAHASLLKLTRLQGQHDAVINKIASILYSNTETSLQNALEHTVKILQCAGGRLYLPRDISKAHIPLVATGIQPVFSDAIAPQRSPAPSPYSENRYEENTGKRNDKTRHSGSHIKIIQSQVVNTAKHQQRPYVQESLNRPALEQCADWQSWLKAEAKSQPFINLWAIANIRHRNQMSPIVSAFIHSNIRSIVVVKLIHRNRFLGYLSLFRQPVDVEQIWAGRPDAADIRQHRPRQSFETWRELRQNQTPLWTHQDIKLIQDLTECLSSILYQLQLYQEVQALNTDLEQRVLQRTAELQQLNQHLRQEIIDREQTLKALEHARDSLKRLSHQNDLILNSAGEGIYGIDPQGIIVFVNQAAAKLLGYPKAELIGQNMHERLQYSSPDGSSYPWKQSAIYKTLKNGQTHHVTGNVIQRNGGCTFPIEYVSTPIWEQETIIGAVITFKDITERQLIEKMKDEFIAVVSHELRTPLTSIHTALGLLAQEHLEIPTERRQQMVNIAASNTNRLVRLVNDILDVERIKLGKITLNKKSCDLSKIMLQAMNEMQAIAEKNKIAIAFQSCSVQLWADPDRIIQTLTNLLSNAIKFSSPNSIVRITAQDIHKNTLLSAQDYSEKTLHMIADKLKYSEAIALVQVRDQGGGIPDDQLEIIFGQFKQLNSSDSSHQGGTGLGLAICRSIVQQHDGKIWAESTIGTGSTFFFVLPTIADT